MGINGRWKDKFLSRGSTIYDQGDADMNRRQAASAAGGLLVLAGFSVWALHDWAAGIVIGVVVFVPAVFLLSLLCGWSLGLGSSREVGRQNGRSAPTSTTEDIR